MSSHSWSGDGRRYSASNYQFTKTVPTGSGLPCIYSQPQSRGTTFDMFSGIDSCPLLECPRADRGRGGQVRRAQLVIRHKSGWAHCTQSVERIGADATCPGRAAVMAAAGGSIWNTDCWDRYARNESQSLVMSSCLCASKYALDTKMYASCRGVCPQANLLHAATQHLPTSCKNCYCITSPSTTNFAHSLIFTSLETRCFWCRLRRVLSTRSDLQHFPASKQATIEQVLRREPGPVPRLSKGVSAGWNQTSALTKTMSLPRRADSADNSSTIQLEQLMPISAPPRRIVQFNYEWRIGNYKRGAMKEEVLRSQPFSSKDPPAVQVDSGALPARLARRLQPGICVGLSHLERVPAGEPHCFGHRAVWHPQIRSRN